MAIRILDPLADGVPMPMISRQARLVISPHMGARYAVMNVVILAPGEKNDPHIHVASEDSMYLLSGSGWVHDLDAGRSEEHTSELLVISYAVFCLKKKNQTSGHQRIANTLDKRIIESH